MMYLGDFNASATVRFMWNTNAIAGESITRATNGTISVYKDGGTTQSTTGVTDTEDFDSLTGVHLCAIDTSADGTFYSAGSDFAVVLSAATIDGKTINGVLAHFSIAARSALRPTTAGRTLDVSAGGEAGVDWANVGSPTTTVGLSGTTVKTATDVETDTADIQSRLPAALVSGRIDASVGAMAANTFTASALADDATTEIAGGIIPAIFESVAASYNNPGTMGEKFNLIETPPSAATVADAVWDEAIAGHAVAGSTGATLSSVGAAADPLLNAVPGSYASGTAGYVLGNLQDNPVNVVTPFELSTSTVTIGYGEDYTSGSTNGLLTLTTAASINLLTIGGTIYFAVRRKSVVANSDPEFTLTGTATAALTFTVSLTNTTTRTLTPNRYLYTAWHVTAGGVRTELLHGDYVVADLALPTVS